MYYMIFAWWQHVDPSRNKTIAERQEILDIRQVAALCVCLCVCAARACVRACVSVCLEYTTNGLMIIISFLEIT